MGGGTWAGCIEVALRLGRVMGEGERCYIGSGRLPGGARDFMAGAVWIWEAAERCCVGWGECTGVRMNVQGWCQPGHAGLQHGLGRVCDNLKEHSEDWGEC